MTTLFKQLLQIHIRQKHGGITLLKKIEYMDLGYIGKIDSQMFGKFLK